MEEQRDEVMATACLRAIQALEGMLTSLRQTARAAGGLRNRAIAQRLEQFACDVELSLHGLRAYAAARRSNSASRRNGR